MDNETSETVTFRYTGQRQDEIPENITNISIDASIAKIGIFFQDEIPEGNECFSDSLRGGAIIDELERHGFQQVAPDLELLFRRDELPFGFSFALNNHLTVAEFHEGLEIIGTIAFALCKALMRISVPTTVREIDDGAFVGCESLIQVEIQEGLKVISSHAFASCTSLSEINFPNSLKHLGGNAFWNCISLSRVSIPSAVTTISARTFSHCTSLREVYLQDGLKALGGCAFERCLSLTTISIPSTVIRIDEGAFSECVSLVEVGISTGLKYLGLLAFENCKSLPGINLPSTILNIEESSFQGCESLLGVEIGVDISVYLPEDCFHSCQSLVNISIPSTMVCDDISFSACPSLLLDSLGTNDEEPFSILRDRFSGLPVHECCYRSTTTSISELFLQIQATNAEEKKMKDVYQMTPFHVLVTTSKLRSDLLDILLNEYPLDILSLKDIHQRTIMDYLLMNLYSWMNRSPLAIDLAKLVLERAIVRESTRYGLSRWSSVLSRVIESMNWNGVIEARRRCVDEVMTQLARCVGTEISSLLELALWKKRMMQSSSGNKRLKMDRESCLMTCGADHVIPNVFGYLHKQNGSEGSTDLSIIPCDLSWLKASPEQE